MSESSLVFKAYDQVSSTMKDIASGGKSLSKEYETLERRAKALAEGNEALRKRLGTMTKDLTTAKKEMQEAQKQFKKTGDEADGLKLEKAVQEYERLSAAIKETKSASEITMKSMKNNADEMRKLFDATGAYGSRTGGIDSIFSSEKLSSLAGGLAQAGIIKELGSSISGALGAGITSYLGQPSATLASGVTSGAVSGAAAGAMLGPWGALIGGGIGAVSGFINGSTKIFEQQDEAFKSYVQDSYQNHLAEQESSLKTGSSIAAGRETDRISFATLFGDAGIADTYLSNLVEMSNNTPFLYDDLTAMSKTLATYKYGANEILPVLQTIGDTGAALGMSTSDMTMVATALGRMKSSNKTSLEYLNILNDRGIGAVGMLSDAYGVDQGTMYDMISKGKIEGTKAAEIILQAMTDSFAGSMENQSKTFSGLTSTVEGLTQELDNAMGEGYNEGRMAGLQAQRDWLSGESGAAVQEANKAIGAWKAELENSKEQYIRDAMDAMMASDEYQTAKASGDAAEMGRLIMEAKVQGMNEYNASDGAQLALESEKKLVDAIRNDASLNQDYWDAGYEKGNWFTKGLAASINNKHGGFSSYEDAVIATGGDAGVLEAIGAYDGFHAFGLKRVPYDGYRAILHEGERVMTAAENRSNSEKSIVVQVSGNEFIVRGEDDIDAIARQIAVRVREAKETYGG